jgi:Protein of unknown function (DUF3429)
MIRPVGSTENGAPATRLDTLAEWAGYLLVAPLAVCLAGVGLLPGYAVQELAQRSAIAWGAVLLAFTGAVHWGLALAGRLSWQRARLGGLVAPLIGAVGVVVGGQRGLGLLVVGFGGFWLYEHRVLGELLPPAYLGLRRPITLAICMLLAVILFVSDAAGLS